MSGWTVPVGWLARGRDGAAMVVQIDRVVTVDREVLGALERAGQQTTTLLDRFSNPLPATIDAGGWDVRHLLSHLIGAWQRLPAHSAFFLADENIMVPMQTDHSYWTAEWATAPIEAFSLALEAAYAGNVIMLQRVDAEALGRSRRTPFGEMTLRQLLMLSYERHLAGDHLVQLAAFLP
jgi:hypothetical protein